MEPHALKDISFADVDHYCRTAKMLSRSDFPPLPLAQESLKLSNFYAAPYNERSFFDLDELNDDRALSEKPVMAPDHAYYQLYFNIIRDEKSLGDVAIELERGKETAFISMWDAIHAKAYPLGTMPLPEKGTVLEALSRYLQKQEIFCETFGFRGTTVDEIIRGPTINGKSSEPTLS